MKYSCDGKPVRRDASSHTQSDHLTAPPSFPLPLPLPLLLPPPPPPPLLLLLLLPTPVPFVSSVS